MVDRTLCVKRAPCANRGAGSYDMESAVGKSMRISPRIDWERDRRRDAELRRKWYRGEFFSAGSTTILLREDELFVPLNFAMTGKEADENAPLLVPNTREAMKILSNNELTGAILDMNLTDGSVTLVCRTAFRPKRSLHREGSRGSGRRTHTVRALRVPCVSSKSISLDTIAGDFNPLIIQVDVPGSAGTFSTPRVWHK